MMPHADHLPRPEAAKPPESRVHGPELVTPGPRIALPRLTARRAPGSAGVHASGERHVVCRITRKAHPARRDFKRRRL